MKLDSSDRDLHTRLLRLEQKYKRRPEDPGSEGDFGFVEDFENWNVNGWTKNEAGSGTILVPLASAKYSGNYGCRCELFNNALPWSREAFLSLDLPQTTTFIHCEFYFRLNSIDINYATGYVQFLALIDAYPGSVRFFFRRQADGNYYLYWWTSDGITGGVETSYPLSTGVWYHLVLKFKVNDSAGYEYISINDTVLRDWTGANLYSGELTFRNVEWGLDVDAVFYTAIQLDFDDMGINYLE